MSRKTWFITGASSGFGRCLAEAVLARGDACIATARTPASLAEVVAQAPDRCIALPLDVSDAASRETCVAAALASPLCETGLDVLVNNAGYGLIGALEECSEAQLRANFETNFFGAALLTQRLLPTFRTQRHGRIVMMSAAAVISNYAGFGVYGASKWALEGMSEALRTELAPLGVKVMIVQPGPFRTSFIARSLLKGQTIIDDYAKTSGQFATLLERMSGKQPGDPARAAQSIIEATLSDAPPARLVLGQYAIDKVRKKLAASEAELRTWEAMGAGADFPKPRH